MIDPVTSSFLVPFVTALVCLGLWCRPRWQGVVCVAGAAAFLAAAVWLVVAVWHAGYVVVRVGNWPSPFGIVLVADLTAALMVLVSAIIGLAVAVYSLEDISAERYRFGYAAFLHFMLGGVCGAFLTGDIFNMFVWFEVMLTSSFALMCLGGERPQMEGAVKYVVLNLISSSLFLAACGILYAKAGSLNLADLAVRARDQLGPEVLAVPAALFLVAFGLKAAVFPLFFWLPASYHTPPVAVSAVFAGLLTKVGVYALVRMFTLVFTQDLLRTHGLLLVVAGLTMVTGVLGAMVQFDMRRLLSFHIVSQIGYMVLGLALFTPLALAGTIFYIFHHIIVKANLFLVSGVVQRTAGTFHLKQVGGLLTASPLLAVLFLVPAFSLGGVPPLSGFFAKLAIVQAGLAGEGPFGAAGPVLAAVALGVGLLTLFSMTKIWAEAFWKPPADGVVLRVLTRRERWLLLGPVGSLAALTVLIGLAPWPLFAYAERAAEQLLAPEHYIHAVLGGGR